MNKNKNIYPIYLDTEGKFTMNNENNKSVGVSGWSLSVPSYRYNYPIYYDPSVYWHMGNTINTPKVVNLTAAGLRHSDIEIKEVDGQLTVKTKSGLTGYYTNINQTYTLKNVKLNSSTLKLGVLTLEFIDAENVVKHNVKEINEL